MALKERNPSPDRARRPAGRRALQLLHHRRSSSRKAPRSPKASVRPGHCKSRRCADRFRLPDSRRGSAADHVRSDGTRGPLPRRLVGHQRRGGHRLAKDLGPGHTIVTVLADYGSRYQSKLFNPDFLRSKNLPVPAWLERRSRFKPPYDGNVTDTVVARWCWLLKEPDTEELPIAPGSSPPRGWLVTTEWLTHAPARSASFLVDSSVFSAEQASATPMRNIDRAYSRRGVLRYRCRLRPFHRCRTCCRGRRTSARPRRPRHRRQGHYRRL